MVWQLFSASLSSSGARSSAQRPVAGTSRSLSLAGDTEANSRQHRLRMWLVRIMGIQGAHTGRRFRRPAHYGITRAWVTKPFGPEGFIGGGCPALLATRRSGIPAGALSEAPPAGTGSLLQLGKGPLRSEEHTSELQSRPHLVCRLLLEKKNVVIVGFGYKVLAMCGAETLDPVLRDLAPTLL